MNRYVLIHTVVRTTEADHTTWLISGREVFYYVCIRPSVCIRPLSKHKTQTQKQSPEVSAESAPEEKSSPEVSAESAPEEKLGPEVSAESALEEKQSPEASAASAPFFWNPERF